MSRKFNIPTDEYVVNPVKKESDLKKDEYIENGKIINIPYDDLVFDEKNSEIYGEETEESLREFTEEIKKNGFKGAILAYPFEIEEKRRYRIESGHRRALAARAAGLTEIPVIITTTPKTESERKIRLISMNLHSRNVKPSVMAKVIETLVDANWNEQTRQNLPNDSATLLEIVAGQMELSVKSIQKYRQFGKLSPVLQELADQGISWSALAQCSTLTTIQQVDLANTIMEEISQVGIENISRPWIVSLATRMKQGQEAEPVRARKVVKRRDGGKIVAKCAKEFDSILHGYAVIKKEDREKTLENLRKIRECVDKKIEELDKDSNQ